MDVAQTNVERAAGDRNDKCDILYNQQAKEVEKLTKEREALKDQVSSIANCRNGVLKVYKNPLPVAWEEKKAALLFEVHKERGAERDFIRAVRQLQAGFGKIRRDEYAAGARLGVMQMLRALRRRCRSARQKLNIFVRSVLRSRCVARSSCFLINVCQDSQKKRVSCLKQSLSARKIYRERAVVCVAWSAGQEAYFGSWANYRRFP